ncbi:MAG: TIGR01459 family HAD-type hydrolase [Pseudomonadota bacterium]|nr:TIGR01459 family HAD-type hydrolase [Pseudomonadota bacterium]
MQRLNGLSPVIDRYDALLLDLWGVVHDGSQLYPGVHATLEKLRGAGKQIIFVSNAPRRAAKAARVLTELGIEQQLYDHVITSGELGYRWLEQQHDVDLGKRYYYIGPAKDADVLNGLDYRRVDDLKDSDFLLNVGFGSEEQSAADWQKLLRAAKAAGLPMFCLNPDFEVVKITGERYACAGVLAADYERLDGRVKYFGKPFAEVYEYCMRQLAPVPRERVLAIGDGISTDIAGAVGYGLDAALVTGGIIRKQADEVEELCEKHNAVPKYIMPTLAW